MSYTSGRFSRFFFSIFWRPAAGLYFVVPLLPLQTARYRLIAFPGGAQIHRFLPSWCFDRSHFYRAAVTLKTPLSKLLLVVAALPTSAYAGLADAAFSLACLVQRCSRIELEEFYCPDVPVPLVVNAIKTKQQMRILLVLMCLGTLILNRQFSHKLNRQSGFFGLSYSGREGGTMGYAGINGLAAFEVQFCLFIWALTLAEKSPIIKIAGWPSQFLPLLSHFSFSRGAYAAF